MLRECNVVLKMSTLYKSLKRQIKNADTLAQLDVIEDKLEHGRSIHTLSAAQTRKLDALLSKKEREIENHSMLGSISDGSHSSSGNEYSD